MHLFSLKVDVLSIKKLRYCYCFIPHEHFLLAMEKYNVAIIHSVGGGEEQLIVHCGNNEGSCGGGQLKLALSKIFSAKYMRRKSCMLYHNIF